MCLCSVVKLKCDAAIKILNSGKKYLREFLVVECGRAHTENGKKSGEWDLTDFKAKG